LEANLPIDAGAGMAAFCSLSRASASSIVTGKTVERCADDRSVMEELPSSGSWHCGGPICDDDWAIEGYKILPGLVLGPFFWVGRIWTRAVGAIQGRHPCLIGQWVRWDTKINISLAQVSDKNTHYSIET
jgi:hypothetical protein